MNTFRPNYYDDFKCIADACKHTCCAGWEIDVDEDSMEVYDDIPYIKKHIKDSSFILEGPSERCPFLLENGLCDLILKYGEDILCDICTDHPRFRNYEGDNEYLGLGLCCEAACDLILNREDKFSLIPETKLPYGIDWANDYPGKISDALRELASDDKTCAERVDLYLNFEILDQYWDELLRGLEFEPVEKSIRDEVIDDHPRLFRNLMIYLLYRHKGNRQYVAQSCWLIAELCANTGLPLVDLCRMYSAEVEYSDINNETMENL
ncbi:MAG: flagellin lysine-N-methylase [Clostridiales bacterium]|nr:flagellin lysine-N-methylase [Clostridiales bacterium]